MLIRCACDDAQDRPIPGASMWLEVAVVELPGASYLYTLATVSITFVGFSAFFVLVRQALGRTMSQYDILLTKNFLQLGFIVTFCSLLAPLLSLLELRQAYIWRIASMISAVPLLLVALTYPRRRFAAIKGPIPKDVLCFIATIFVSGLILLANAFGWPQAPGVGLYVCGLTIVLSISFLAFLLGLDAVLEQPKRISDGLHSPAAGNGLTLSGRPHIAASGGSPHGPPG